jgi:hypothetical protein
MHPGLTRCVSKRDVSSDESPIRLRQHGTLFIFFHKKIHKVNFFVKKNEIFRPAGGESGRSSR